MATSEPHPTFVVERYWPDSSPAEFERVTTRLSGTIVRSGIEGLMLVHSTYVPTDETAQWVVRAPSAGAVEALFATAGVTFERLLPAIESAVTRPSPTHHRADRRSE